MCGTYSVTRGVVSECYCSIKLLALYCTSLFTLLGKIFMYFLSGKCFVDIAEEMKEVYAVYCRNHDDAISLMEKVHVTFLGTEGIIH